MAKSLWTRVALSGCLVLLCAPTAEARGRSLEAGVLAELNFARTQPAAYAQARLRDPYGSRATGAYDDPEAYEEAIAFLRRQRPLPPLRPDPSVAGAALSHAIYQGRGGGFGHAGPRGESLSERLHRHGAYAMVMAEDISYGYVSPQDVVRQLIVDSGVPGRGHRDNIFNPLFRQAGVACGPHRRYGALCVVDFTGRLMRR